MRMVTVGIGLSHVRHEAEEKKMEYELARRLRTAISLRLYGLLPGNCAVLQDAFESDPSGFASHYARICNRALRPCVVPISPTYEASHIHAPDFIQRVFDLVPWDKVDRRWWQYCYSEEPTHFVDCLNELARELASPRPERLLTAPPSWIVESIEVNGLTYRYLGEDGSVARNDLPETRVTSRSPLAEDENEVSFRTVQERLEKCTDAPLGLCWFGACMDEDRGIEVFLSLTHGRCRFGNEQVYLCFTGARMESTAHRPCIPYVYMESGKIRPGMRPQMMAVLPRQIFARAYVS